MCGPFALRKDRRHLKGRSESSGDAESEGDQTILGQFPLAPRRAKGVWPIVEGCAAHDTKTAVSVRSRRSVAGVIRVFLVPAILRPFPDVAVHVVETPGVGEKTVHCNG